MTDRFQAKNFIVTGAGRGIGRVIAEDLAREGARVAIIDLDEDRATMAAEALGPGHLGTSADVTSPSEVAAAFDTVDAAFERLDGLVNCAGGYSENITFLDITEADYDLVLDSNLKGTFLCCQEAVRRMRVSGGGAIVNFSSLAGRSTSPALGSHYTAAKAGVLGLTRHIAREFGPDGIRANAMAPGTTEGERVSAILTDADRQRQIAGIPLGRLATAGDLAPVVLFLLSSDAGYISGATIDVSGAVLPI